MPEVSHFGEFKKKNIFNIYVREAKKAHTEITNIVREANERK